MSKVVTIASWKKHVESQLDEALPNGSDGGNNGGMEARIAKLEANVDHIQSDVTDVKTDLREYRKEQRSDFRLGVGITVTATLGLAGLIAKGFGWLL